MKKAFGIILKGKKIKGVLACLIIVSIVTGFILVLANELLGRAFNDYLLLQDLVGFVPIVLGTVGLFILVFVLSILSANLRANFQYTSLSRLAGYYIERLLRAKNSFFTNRPSAELFAKLNESSYSVSFLFTSLLGIVSYGIIMTFYGIIIFRLDVLAGVFTVLVTPIYFLMNGWAGGMLSELMHERLETDGEMNTVTQEAFENVSNVKAKGAFSFFTGRSVGVLHKIERIGVAENTLEGYIHGITVLLRIITPLLIIWAAMGFSSDFEGGATKLILLYINIPLFLGNFAYVFEQYIEYKAARPFLSQLKEYDDIELENEEGIEITAFESLRTEGVSVVFDGGREVAVPNFEIKKNEKIMFFGESGIGKSTIFNIIMGLITEYEGAVFINGVNLREVSITALRKVFGITFQHTNALTLDLRGNILLGTSLADEKLDELIRLTALENRDDVKGSTVLNNKVLSGGEKSRLGLSQTLVTNPEIMLIDEAFSNMDEALEYKILTDLFREYPNRTVICISHRTSGSGFFDRVVDFNT